MEWMDEYLTLCRCGYNVNCDRYAVRPALRISLFSDQVSYAGTVCSDGTVDEVAPVMVQALPAFAPWRGCPASATGRRTTYNLREVSRRAACGVGKGDGHGRSRPWPDAQCV